MHKVEMLILRVVDEKHHNWNPSHTKSSLQFSKSSFFGFFSLDNTVEREREVQKFYSLQKRVEISFFIKTFFAENGKKKYSFMIAHKRQQFFPVHCWSESSENSKILIHHQKVFVETKKLVNTKKDSTLDEIVVQLKFVTLEKLLKTW